MQDFSVAGFTQFDYIKCKTTTTFLELERRAYTPHDGALHEGGEPQKSPLPGIPAGLGRAGASADPVAAPQGRVCQDRS